MIIYSTLLRMTLPTYAIASFIELHPIQVAQMREIGRLGRRYPASKEQLEDEGQAEEREMSELRIWEKVMMDCLIGKDLS